MEEIRKVGYLSDMDKFSMLYTGKLTFNDNEIYFSGRGHGLAVFKSLKLSIPLNSIKNVSIKNIWWQKHVNIEFTQGGKPRRVMIRPLKHRFLKLFDDSEKWNELLLKKLNKK